MPDRRPPPAPRTSLRLVLPLAAALLGGCASAPRLTQPLPGASGECRAAAPNLRAAYNRGYNVRGRYYTPLRDAGGYDEQGVASWYGWESGSTTSMGTAFSPRAYTAASRDLPLPTCVQVTNLANGRSALVLVNDRGPFVDGRIMDLSWAAAKALDVTRTGTAQVRIVALAGTGTPPASALGAPLPAPPAPAPPAPAAPSQTASAAAAPSPGAAPIFTEPAAPPADSDALDALIASAALAPDAAQPLPSAPSLAAASSVAPQATGPLQTYLQVGAFTLQANAGATRDRLQGAGIGPVEIVPGLIRGQTYYRVQVGPLPQALPDAALRQQLADLGIAGYSVVEQ